MSRELAFDSHFLGLVEAGGAVVRGGRGGEQRPDERHRGPARYAAHFHLAFGAASYAGTKLLRLGIATCGSVDAFITALSSITPFNDNRYAVSA